MIKLLIKSLKEALCILIIVTPLALIANQLRTNGIPLWPSSESNSITKGPDVISVKKAAGHFRGKDALFLDARAPEDYCAGHIAGALNLPLHQFDEYFLSVAPTLEASQVIITYCDGIDCTQGHDLAVILKEMGFKRVFFLVNGWSRWMARGLPVEKEELTSG